MILLLPKKRGLNRIDPHVEMHTGAGAAIKLNSLERAPPSAQPSVNAESSAKLVGWIEGSNHGERQSNGGDAGGLTDGVADGDVDALADGDGEGGLLEKMETQRPMRTCLRRYRPLLPRCLLLPEITHIAP